MQYVTYFIENSSDSTIYDIEKDCKRTHMFEEHYSFCL